MWFELYETCIVNQNAAKGLPNNVGDIALVTGHREKSNYDYLVEFANGETAFVRENEIDKLTDEQKELAEYIFFGSKVLHKSNEVVKVIKVDYINNQAEVEFVSGGTDVVSFDSLKEIEKENISVEEKLGKFGEIGLEIGKFTDMKNKQYGSSVDATYEIIKVLMERYKNNDNTYTIPESLLKHILLQVRMMDKSNRIFNNPSGEGDSESPYNDLAGYSLIGIDMVNIK